jgi:hypothetical protein
VRINRGIGSLAGRLSVEGEGGRRKGCAHNCAREHPIPPPATLRKPKYHVMVYGDRLVPRLSVWHEGEAAREKTDLTEKASRRLAEWLPV